MEGRAEQHPGPFEGEDDEYSDLPRSTVTFSRKDIGPLRPMAGRYQYDVIPSRLAKTRKTARDYLAR